MDFRYGLVVQQSKKYNRHAQKTEKNAAPLSDDLVNFGDSMAYGYLEGICKFVMLRKKFLKHLPGILIPVQFFHFYKKKMTKVLQAYQKRMY